MIDLYTWTTPNGYKVSVMLEEVELPYEVHPINIGEGQQFTTEFVAICPNSKIPAIVDGEVSVFESGAILIYLAEQTGKLLPTKGPERAKVLEWLMFQMANVGPMLGQANHFVNTAEEKIPYAIDRYLTESARLMKVVDDQLGRTEYLGGDYSIADVASYPWLKVAYDVVKNAKPDVLGSATHLSRWLEEVGARSAVKAGMQVP